MPSAQLPLSKVFDLQLPFSFGRVDYLHYKPFALLFFKYKKTNAIIYMYNKEGNKDLIFIFPILVQKNRRTAPM